MEPVGGGGMKAYIFVGSRELRHKEFPNSCANEFCDGVGIGDKLISLIYVDEEGGLSEPFEMCQDCAHRVGMPFVRNEAADLLRARLATIGSVEAERDEAMARLAAIPDERRALEAAQRAADAWKRAAKGWRLVARETTLRVEAERLRVALAVVVGTARGNTKSGMGCPLCYGHYQGDGIGIYIHEATCAYEQARAALGAPGEEQEHGN
jgi:hypothetical protein